MKLRVWVVLAIVWLGLVASSFEHTATAKGPEVLIYTSNSGIEQMLDKAAKIWSERTGVKVAWIVPGGSGAVVQKAIQEKDRPQADIVIASLPPMLAAKEAGALAQYIPPNAEHIPGAFKDTDGYFTGWFAFYNCFLYNPDFAPDPPKTLKDLLDLAYVGKIMYPDPRTSGDGIRFVANIVLVMGEDEGFQFLKDLEESVIGHPSLVQGSLIDRGEVWIAVSDSSQSLTDYFNEGLTKQLMHFTEEGTIAGYVAIALTKGGPNPNDAKDLLNFLLSEEAQIFVATQGYGIPVRESVSLPADLMDTFQPVLDAKVLDVDWEWLKENMDRWRDRWISEVLGS